jgi:hypothetical protein
MNTSTLYAILISANQATMRLGWVSSSTGLTYCGICLRASLAPEVGSECSGCGARVTKVFELSAGSNSMLGAWKDATTIAGRLRLSGAAS